MPAHSNPDAGPVKAKRLALNNKIKLLLFFLCAVIWHDYNSITQNSNEYRAITNEVMALFTWLRRFAEGLIEGEEETQD